MKTFYFFLLTIFYSVTAFATIDSVKVSIHQSNPKEWGWEYDILYADSFSNGLQINKLQQSWSANSWVNTNLEINSYDSSGNMIEKIYSVWQSNQWVVSRKWIYNYISGDALLDVTMQTWDGTAWKDSTLETYYYDGGNDTLRIIQRWINSTWINYTKQENIFDTDSFLIEKTLYVWDTTQSTWNNSQKYLYAHDSNGNDTSVIFQQWLGMTWQNSNREVYGYNAFGNVTVNTSYDWDSFMGEWAPWDQTDYLYNILNQLTGYNWDCFQGACGFAYGTYLYDQQGNRTYYYYYSETMGGIPSAGRWYYLYFGSGSNLINVFAVDDFEKCSADTLLLDAFSVGGTEPIHYQWSPAAGLSSDTILNPYVFADTTTEYTLTATDSNGSSDSVSVVITVYQNPVANVSIQSLDTSTLCNSGILAADSLSQVYCTWYFNGVQQINPFGYSVAHFPIDENGWYKVWVQYNGCGSFDSIEVTEFTNPAPAVTIIKQCNILLAQTAGNVSYQWYRYNVLIPGSTYDTLNVISNGSYSVTVVDSNGCMNVSSPLSFALMSIQFNAGSTCHDTCNGALSLNIYGASYPWHYQWSTGDTTPAIYGLCAGLYTATITDSRGCVVSKTDSVKYYQYLSTNIITGTVEDSLSCNGVAFITVYGNVSNNYTYLWSDGSTTYATTNLCAGWNTVNVTTNFNQCSQADSFYVSVVPNNDSCSLAVTGSDPTCVGYCDGNAQLSFTGSTPFSSLWIEPVIGTINTSVNNLCPGNYSAFMIDGDGCVDSGYVTIDERDSIEAEFTILFASPQEPCSTLVSVTFENDNEPTGVYWQCSGTSGDQSYLCPGICNITVEDQLGCVAYFSFDVPDSITACSITSVVTGVSCYGNCDGSATVIPNGIPPFQIVWSSGDTGVSVSNLCPGTYSVTMQDSIGCISTTSVTITEPPPIVSIISSSYFNCQCLFSANVIGGIPPYAYQWCDNSTAPQMINCLAGLCLLQITDANGCLTMDTVMIAPPPALSVSATGNDASCNGCVDGSINATVLGGIGPYTYALNTGSTNSTGIFTGLAAGSYTVCVTDVNACTACTQIVVGQPPLACSVTIISVNSILCNGDCNGSLTAGANGVPPFHFLWSTSDTTATINNLCAGIYTVVMTDSVGCIDSATVVLGEPPLLIPIHTTVYGCDSCVTSVTVNGGTPPYTYQWCDGSIGPELYFCGPGICVLNIVDANGCVVQDTVILNPPPPLILTVQSNGTNCAGCNDGNVTASATGGTPGYTYELIPGGTNTTGFFSGLSAGPYVLCVTDANNCTLCDSVTVAEDPTGIFSIDKNNRAIVYPNPFTHETILEVNTDLLKYNPEFIISDLLGNNLSSTSILQQKTVIERENLPSGIYFYRLRSGKSDFAVGKLFVTD